MSKNRWKEIVKEAGTANPDQIHYDEKRRRVELGGKGHKLCPLLHPYNGEVVWLQERDRQHYFGKGFKTLTNEQARQIEAENSAKKEQLEAERAEKQRVDDENVIYECGYF